MHIMNVCTHVMCIYIYILSENVDSFMSVSIILVNVMVIMIMIIIVINIVIVLLIIIIIIPIQPSCADWTEETAAKGRKTRLDSATCHMSNNKVLSC